MNKILIVGGTARSAKLLIHELEKNNYSINLMTFRQKNKIYGNYNWIELDLENDTSVTNFIKSLPKNFYSKIIFLSGNSLSKKYLDINKDELKHFYNSYIYNYNQIIIECMESINENGEIIFVSSIAANRPINDIHYSSAKAANQALVKSLSLYVKKNQSIYSIAPGTITDNVLNKIIEIIINGNKNNNGKVFEVGY
ncbi:SDR family oxidoreductase [bacterium]|nr:SDR family oxidoreductase [bacterium]